MTLPISVLHLTQDVTPVGSRRTCDPAPLDTDDDWLVLVKDSDVDRFSKGLFEEGWRLGGSQPTNETQIKEDEQFWSYTLDRVNLIVTTSSVFHDRFLAATAVAKRLNLMSKRDRIALFQAVLYANGSST